MAMFRDPHLAGIRELEAYYALALDVRRVYDKMHGPGAEDLLKAELEDFLKQQEDIFRKKAEARKQQARQLRKTMCQYAYEFSDYLSTARNMVVELHGGQPEPTDKNIDAYLAHYHKHTVDIGEILGHKAGEFDDDDSATERHNSISPSVTIGDSPRAGSGAGPSSL